MLNKLQGAAAGGENIVVSVGLLPLEVAGDGNGKRGGGRCWFSVGARENIPFGCVHVRYFRVQPEWVAEEVGSDVSWGEKTGGGEEMRRRSVMGGGLAKKMGYPEVLAMDSRVRTG